MGRDSEIAQIGQYFKSRAKELKARSLAHAERHATLPWVKRTKWHWIITIERYGCDVEYWPSTRKVRWAGDGRILWMANVQAVEANVRHLQAGGKWPM